MTASIASIGEGPLAKAVAAQNSPADPARAELVVIDTGDDAATLRELAKLSASPSRRVIVNLSGRAVREAVQARNHPGLVAVDAHDLAASHSIAAEALYETAAWRNQSRLHVVLAGFGARGKAALAHVAMAGIAGTLGTPLIRITTPDPDEAARYIAREMPEIGQSAEIVISGAGAEELGDPARSPLVEAEASAPLTAIIVSGESADETLAVSAAIARLQDRYGRAQAALMVGGPGSAEAVALALPARPAHDLARRISRMPDVTDIPDLVNHILEGRDVLARRIHEAYRSLYGSETKAGTGWDELAETYKRANRSAAQHFAQKLFTIGLVQPASAKPGAIEPVTFTSLIEPLAKSAIEDDTMRRLARLEHDRWALDRRLDGWEYGDVRDDARRRHPSLVPFDDPRLSAREIGKDIDQVRFLFGSVLRPEAGGAAARLIIGIVAADTQQPGIGLDAVLVRLEQEPHRFPILISPLMAESEAKFVSEIIAALKKPFTLIVPEWQSGSPRPAAAAELLKRAETRIAPIGPPGFRDRDAWADADEDGAAALVNYVSARADLLLPAQPAAN